METLNHGNNALTITLGAQASEAGLVTLTGGTGANITTIGAGFTNDLAVTVVAGTETLTATNYTGKLAVTADIDSITAADTLTGGTGVDTLTLTLSGGDTALAAADLANVTNFDTVAFGSNAATAPRTEPRGGLRSRLVGKTPTILTTISCPLSQPGSVTNMLSAPLGSLV